MKIGITYLLLILSLSALGQINDYPNDSISIITELEKSEFDNAFIGDKMNGIYRHYRKIENTWVIVGITYYMDKKFIWACKPNDYNFDFDLDYINLNRELVDDSMTIRIPFETGKTWMQIHIKNKQVYNVIIYDRQGNKNAEFIYDLNEPLYKEYYANGIIKQIREGKFYMNKELKKGTIRNFDNIGRLIESFEINKIDNQ